jgi:hypothetical protein
MSFSCLIQEKFHQDPFGNFLHFHSHGTKHHQSFQKDYNSSGSLPDVQEELRSGRPHQVEGKIIHLHIHEENKPE